jgi:hypothetical protein
VIPWATILRHAPTILAAAEALRARTKASSDDQARATDTRIAELEEGARASAQLSQEMAQQIHALTMAHAVNARRLQIALGVGGAAAVLAIVGIVLALV